MNEAEFLQKYLPAGATSANEVLYDFDSKFSPTLSTQLLTECLTDLLPLLRGAQYSLELYESGFSACELTLSLLGRAQEEGIPLPNREASAAVISEGSRIVNASRIHRMFYGADATKRVFGMVVLLGGALEPLATD
jgi:hypothetical protein